MTKLPHALRRQRDSSRGSSIDSCGSSVAAIGTQVNGVYSCSADWMMATEVRVNPAGLDDVTMEDSVDCSGKGRAVGASEVFAISGGNLVSIVYIILIHSLWVIIRVMMVMVVGSTLDIPKCSLMFHLW